MAKLAQWRGTWLGRRTEPEWMSRQNVAVVGLWLLLACLLMAFGFAVVASAIVADLVS
jgi:hypothetical protein